MSGKVRVFVTYRREDTAAYAGRLHDALIEAFDDDNVFQDVTAIEPGDDFEVAIDAALDEADAVLVVIGPNWLTPEPGGQARLHDAGDFVRIEISKSLTRGIRVIPVLVGGASLPPPAELPEDLAPLTKRQAVQLRDITWRQDVEGLIRSLRGERLARRTRMWWVVASVGLVAVAVIGIVALLPDGDGGTGDDPPPCEDPQAQDWTQIFTGSATGSAEAVGEAESLDFEVTAVWYHPLETGTWEVVLDTVMTNSTASGYDHDHWRYERLVVERFSNDGPTCFSGAQSNVLPGERDRALVGFEVTEEPVRTLGLGVALASEGNGMVEIVLTDE